MFSRAKVIGLEEKGGNAEREEVAGSIKKLQEEELRIWRYNEAEYLIADRDYFNILCFEGTVSKNSLVARIAKLFRSLNTAELIVFRLLEIGLLELVVIDSYQDIICRGKGKRRKCEERTKNIYGIRQSEELRRVCESKRRSL